MQISYKSHLSRR